MSFTRFALALVVVQIGLFAQQSTDALKLLERAKAGDPEAQFRIGLSSVSGAASALDVSEGFRWLEAAAEQNYGLGLLILAREYDRRLPRSAEKVFYWYRKAAEFGFPVQVQLARHYETGDGVAVNLPQAAFLYRAAAERKEISAYVGLASMLARGGVNRDIDEAIFWYKKAAVYGDVRALHGLALAYLKRDSFRKEYSSVLELLQMPPNDRGGCPGQPIPAGFGKRAIAELSRRAADSHYASSQILFGLLRYHGHGVRKNRVEALKWMTLGVAGSSGQVRDAVAILAGIWKGELSRGDLARVDGSIKLWRNWHPYPIRCPMDAFGNLVTPGR